MSLLTDRVSLFRIPALLLICLAFIAAAPGFAGATSNQASEQASTAGVVETAVSDLDAIWGEVFATNGLEYAGPAVVLFDGAVATACGDLSGADYYGYYCGSDGTIYLDATGLVEIGNSYGTFAVAVLIADTWGYYIQHALGSSASGVDQTLQATCLAGAWAWYAAELGFVDEDDLGGAIAFYAESLQDGEVLAEVFIYGFEADSVSECFIS